MGDIFIICSQDGKVWTPPDLSDGHFKTEERNDPQSGSSLFQGPAFYSF